MPRKYFCVRQDGQKDCGICSLLTIVKTYGGKVSKEYLRELSRTTKDGVDAFHLLEAANKIGFMSKGVKGDYKTLSNELLPCIAHTIIDNNLAHFVVIHKIDYKKQKVLIADPAKGLRTFSFFEFDRITSNQFLLLKPNRKIIYEEEQDKVGKIIKKFLFKYKNLILYLFILSFIYTFFSIIIPFHFKFMIDNALYFDSKNNLWTISILMILFVFLKELSQLFRLTIMNKLQHFLDSTIMQNIFKHLLSLPYFYYKNRTTGEVLSRIIDATEIKSILSKLLVTVIIDGLFLIMVWSVLFYLNHLLAVVTLLFAILFLIISFLYQKLITKKIALNRDEGAKVNSYIIEMMTGIETIKNNNCEMKTYDDLVFKYQKFLKNNYDYNQMFTRQQLVKESIKEIFLICILSFGGIFVVENKLSLGTLITLNSLLSYFLEPLQNVYDLGIELPTLKVILTRLNELYYVKREKLLIDKKYQNNFMIRELEIKNLSYSYNGILPILKNINLSIKEGEKILLYGASGSGKSTLAKILFGQLSKAKGTILFNQRTIENINLLNLRQTICYVSQNEILFTDSLYNNIILDKLNDFDSFLKVCELTFVNEIVRDSIVGYDLLIEENGFNLSGGERQRIILARSLLKNSSFYIFDESLSEIDIEKEYKILENVFTTYPNKTFLIISHRLSNLSLFDRKIEFKNGFCYER